MNFLRKDVIFLSSILMLLSTTTCAIYSEAGFENTNIKSATFVSEKFEVGPGKVAAKTFYNVEFPKGHVGIKSFDAELVDEEGNSVPLYEAYLHHWFAIKYYAIDWNMSKIIPKNPMEEHGKPSNVPSGYQEKWLLNLTVIDTRGTKHRKLCTECRRNLLLPRYNLQCKLKKGFEAPTRKLALRYKITWVDWNQQQIPVRFYILDSTDRVRTNGSQVIHDCQAEFTIPPNNGRKNSTPHVEKANIPMERGGYLIYGTSHMHTGVINSTLYGQDGRILYTSKPTYGKGTEPGNEKGYVVGMSGSYPELGSIKIKDGEIVTVETRYKSGFLTGAMGHMYIYLADRLP
ncbi:hypothetical protein QL285_049728 [Trifolium repens]|nr:hypothetical protein QL285_049728 [Trifolium repens]